MGVPFDWRTNGGEQDGGQLADLPTVVYPATNSRAVIVITATCAASL